MMKIAFIRSIDVQQTTPYLAEIAETLGRYGVEAKLFYTDGHCTAVEFPGEVEKLPEAVLANDIADRILAWNADAAISLSIPDENALRDAAVRNQLLAHKISVIAHSLDTACAFANKWETKQVISRFGLDTARGFLVDGDLLNKRNLPVPAYRDFVRNKCEQIGYPLLCKPLWDCVGNGIRYLVTPNDLEDYFANPYNGNVVIEKCVIGELCSVEIMGQNGEYIFQPLIWKAQSSASPRLAFTRVMHNTCNRALLDDFNGIRPKLIDLCTRLNVCGAIEIEMIYLSGVYHIIEINPRVSGSTSLSIASSGLNTYSALIHMALGNWSEFYRSYREGRYLGLQFPYIRRKLGFDGPNGDIKLIRASSFNINNIERPNAVISCPLSKTKDVAHWIESRFEIDPPVLNNIELVSADYSEFLLGTETKTPAKASASGLELTPVA